METQFYLHPSAKGRLTPQALLRSEGTIDITIDKDHFMTDVVYFHIATDGWWFGFGYKNGMLVMQRREYYLAVDASFLDELPGNHTLLASWTMDRITFLLGPVGFEGPSISRYVNIKPVPPPAILFEWVRKQSLIHNEQFISEEDFLLRVHTSLAELELKIENMHNKNIFWDIIYDGQKIIRRKPKKEIDLHPIILSLLSDQMFISSISIYPELQTGVGKLDFLFVGYVKNKGISKICAEFKHLHANDLEHGLAVQLPTYMNNQKIEHGTYCILDFRGEWFNKPLINDDKIYTLLGKAQAKAQRIVVEPIKIHHFHLGKLVSASRT